MKRSADGASSIPIVPVRLNIGGVLFDTTRETLAKSAYWDSLLAAKFGNTTDKDGRLFVDRDGKLFAHLLEFMRSRVRPSNEVLANYKAGLVSECEYFGLAWMLSDLRGEISLYDMPPEDRIIRRAEMDGCSPCVLHNIFSSDFPFIPRAHMGMPLLMSGAPQPIICERYECAYDRLDAFTGGLLEAFKDIPGLVIAGGAVVSALVGVDSSDIDVFFTKNHDSALRSAFAAIQRNQSGKTGSKTCLLVLRSNSAVTVIRASSASAAAKTKPVQLITTKYYSAAEILANFDVDSCCVAWSGSQFVCSARGSRALSHGVNVADNKRFDGPVYCQRLEKYARRGLLLSYMVIRTHMDR